VPTRWASALHRARTPRPMASTARVMIPCDFLGGRALLRDFGLEAGRERLRAAEPERVEPRAGARPPERLDARDPRAGADDREEPLAERARDVRGEADVRDAMGARLAGNPTNHGSHTRNTLVVAGFGGIRPDEGSAPVTSQPSGSAPARPQSHPNPDQSTRAVCRNHRAILSSEPRSWRRPAPTHQRLGKWPAPGRKNCGG